VFAQDWLVEFFTNLTGVIFVFEFGSPRWESCPSSSSSILAEHKLGGSAWLEQDF
jgi:hypothetical protein